MKTDISDDFPIFSYIDEEIEKDRKRKETIFKRKINDQSILIFKTILSTSNWEALYLENHPDIASIEYFQNKEFLKFPISSQTPRLWNKILSLSIKGLDTLPLFKARFTDIILNRDNVFQKQPSRVVLRKTCSENMQQIYRRTPMLKCDFNKVAVFSCKFAAYFQNIFL